MSERGFHQAMSNGALMLKVYLLSIPWALVVSTLITLLALTSQVGLLVAAIVSLPWNIFIFLSSSDTLSSFIDSVGFGALLQESNGWGNVTYPLLLSISIGSFVNSYIISLILVANKLTKDKGK